LLAENHIIWPSLCAIILESPRFGASLTSKDLMIAWEALFDECCVDLLNLFISLWSCLLISFWSLRHEFAEVELSKILHDVHVVEGLNGFSWQWVAILSYNFLRSLPWVSDLDHSVLHVDPLPVASLTNVIISLH